MLQITPLIQERIRLLRDVLTSPISFSPTNSRPTTPPNYPEKRRRRHGARVLESASKSLPMPNLLTTVSNPRLRAASVGLGIKAGQMFEPVRVAVCGRKTAPPLFGTLEVLGREACLTRITQALAKLIANSPPI